VSSGLPALYDLYDDRYNELWSKLLYDLPSFVRYVQPSNDEANQIYAAFLLQCDSPTGRAR
jgi:hypothetical protein